MDLSIKPWMQSAAVYVATVGALLALAAIVSGQASPFWLAASLAATLAIAVTQSVGYHRLFSHRTFKCHRLWHWIFAYLGTVSFQSSPIAWCFVHHAHHRYSDTDKDPHIASWRILLGNRYRPVNHSLKTVGHLVSDPMHVFFHKYGLAIALGTAMLLLLVGWQWFLYVLMLPMFMGLANLILFQIYSHDANGATDRPYMEFIFPIAGEWYHRDHHTNPGLTRFGRFDLGAKVIDLIKI